MNSFKLTHFARIPKVIRVIWFLAASNLCGGTNLVREPYATIPKPLQSARAPLKEEVSRGPRGFHQIALTFDAGGEAEALPALLAVLRGAQIHATFFLTGDWVQHYPAYAAMIANEGHDVGNHTHHHRDLTLLADSEIADEIESADALLTQRFNRPIRPLFRAPFGSCDRRIRAIIQRLGYRSVYWTIDTLDAMEPRKDPRFIEERVLTHSREELDGAIILMHVGYPETVKALSVVIRELRTRGFEFVTLKKWL